MDLSRGTIRPTSNFNPDADCQAIRKATKGLGTDEQALINVLAHRTNFERQQIRTMYKTLFGLDLIEELKSELTGNFEKAVVNLVMPPDEFDAHCLHNAMAGVGTKESVLTEIICTRTNQQIHILRATYKRLFGDDLETTVGNETSGFYKRVLVSSLQGNRSDPQQAVDHALAKREAQELHEAGEKKWGTDESCFIRIMAVRNPNQLRETFAEYKKITTKDIFATIESELSGDLREALKALAKSQVNRPAYFAQRLYEATAGLGTDDFTLIRILVSRSEIDLANIKEEFQKIYKKSLESFVADDTDGDYKNFLLALIKGNY